MIDNTVKLKIDQLAKEYGYETAALLAIIDIESAGKFEANVDGTMHPLIRFEGHWFDKLLPEAQRTLAREQALASPKAGAIANPRSQQERWDFLKRACAINEEAALSATSWGAGQVMGFHWKTLGFESVQGLRKQACEGVEGQMRLMLRFLSVNELNKALSDHNWARFAKAYNGPAYAQNNYDKRLQQSYERFLAGGS